MDGAYASRLIDQMILLKRGHDQHCKSLLAEYNLRASDMVVLMYFTTHPECHTAQTICDSQLMAKSLVSTSVEAMVNRGFLHRESDPQDRRRMLLTLQPAAQEIIDKMNALSRQYTQRLLSGVDPQDLQAMERVLARISHNMNNTPETN